VDEVNSLITSISAAVEEQSATTEEISRSIEVVARDAEILTNKAGTLVKITDTMVESVISMDKEFAKFKVSNKAVPLIRGKIAHAIFLNNLQQCVESGKCDFNVVDHNNCEFGKFYNNEGRKLYGHYSEFQEIEPIHAKVHSLGKSILDAVQNADVNNCKDLYEEFQNVIDEFLNKMNALIKIVENS
jgi:methyl-accepting chemotaxis protein